MRPMAGSEKKKKKKIGTWLQKSLEDEAHPKKQKKKKKVLEDEVLKLREVIHSQIW